MLPIAITKISFHITEFSSAEIFFVQILENVFLVGLNWIYIIGENELGVYRGNKYWKLWRCDRLRKTRLRIDRRCEGISDSYGTPCVCDRAKIGLLISVSQSASQSAAFSPLRVIKSIFPLLEGTRFVSLRKGRTRIRRVIQFYYFSVSAGSTRDILHLSWITSTESAANEVEYFYVLWDGDFIIPILAGCLNFSFCAKWSIRMIHFDPRSSVE